MLMMKMMLTFSSILFLMSNSSMIMILSLLMAIISGSFIISIYYKTIWLTFMLIMLTVGGMMIIYVFILSMNFNEKLEMNFKKKYLYFLLIFLIMMKMNPQEFMKSINNTMTLNSKETIILILMTITIFMIFLSKMIMSPFSPSKSVK